MCSEGGGPEFVIVDGEEMIPVPRAAIAPPDMNFGQMHHWENEGQTPLFYSCAMHTPVFLDLTGDWFASWREDILAELENEPPRPGSAEAHWHNLGALELDALIEADPMLAAHLLRPQAFDLCQLLGAQGRSPVRYCMVSVEDLLITPAVVRMDGVAFRVG